MIIRCPSKTHKAGRFKHVRGMPIWENKMLFIDKSFMIIHFIESRALVINTSKDANEETYLYQGLHSSC